MKDRTDSDGRSVKELKKQLRREITEELEAMPADLRRELSGRIVEKVLETREYRLARRILAYLPMDVELRLLPLLSHAVADGKEVFLPVIESRPMVFRRWFSADVEELVPGKYGIPYPPPGTPDWKPASPEDSLIIVPGLAFNHEGARLGRGRGYYDEFLKQHPGLPGIALCYSLQIRDSIPEETGDVRVDRIISE